MNDDGREPSAVYGVLLQFEPPQPSLRWWETPLIFAMVGGATITALAFVIACFWR